VGIDAPGTPGIASPEPKGGLIKIKWHPAQR
jgi:hypothetical protein